MKSLYIDNYRGFSDSIISLSDVNFCVGENSTGKTSILSAINLLASGRFWFEQNFEGPEVPFKHFEDFVSAASDDKRSFYLGVVDSEAKTYREEGRDGAKVFGRAYLFKYSDHDGVPRLESFTSNFKNQSLTVYFSENATRYRVCKIKERDISSKASQLKLFRNWVQIQGDRRLLGTKVLKDEVSIKRGYMPLIYSFVWAARNEFFVIGKDGRKNSAAIPFPSPLFGGDGAAWIAPIRTKPRRTYDEPKLEFSPEGTHVPYLLKKILSGGKDSDKFVTFLRKFGKESGLFKEIKVHKFGKSATSPFEIEIILDSNPLNINNVGYGVAQGLPIIVEAFTREPGSFFVIQQPEVHLHPRAQASIGEMIFNLALKDGKKFVVETHSDFTIDRFRIALRASAKHDVSSQVLFFERSGGFNKVTAIPIGRDGELDPNQPSAYRDFFFKEEIKVIGF